MKKIKGAIWGVILVAVGVLLGLKSLGIIDINIFFKGWWTLFIIVPCFVGLITEHDKGDIIGIIIGLFLLLCCQGVLSFSLLWKLLVPAIIIIIGLYLILVSFFKTKLQKAINQTLKNGGTLKNCCATFSGHDEIFDGEIFEGAELNAVFGGIKCDLRNAILEKDAVIKVSAIFGGIDILVPENVNVKTDVTSIFGGVGNKTITKPDAPTIYISGNCLFGGVDIK